MKEQTSARTSEGTSRTSQRARLARSYGFPMLQDSLAEWSKALAQGASPQGRGFEPHSCHLLPEPDL